MEAEFLELAVCPSDFSRMDPLDPLGLPHNDGLGNFLFALCAVSPQPTIPRSAVNYTRMSTYAGSKFLQT